MIKIRNLFKEYPIKGSEPVLALNNINLVLQDKGLIFVVGKSGSGKSTFLNLLGSLDKSTKGEIIADNNNLNEMNETTASIYRNEYVGFIFQDFCLINTLNVEDNIMLSLDIKDERNKDLLNETLKLVELEGFNKRFPNSLSAGQKQRVAIARGYIKKPKLLLCDEPTGNLDNKTSKQVLKILKELSKNTLVIIVSHNIDDAYQYGDRIIELSDGSIVSDLSNQSQSEQYEINGNKLYVNSLNNLSSEQLDEINERIQKGEIKAIRPHTELFQEKTENNGEMQDFSLKKHKYSLKKRLGLSWKFQKRKIPSAVITSIISAMVMVLLGLCQFFTAFSLNDVMKKSFTTSEEKIFALRKAYYTNDNKNDINTSSLVSITDDDMEMVKNSKYEGNVYTLYDYPLPISLKSWRLINEVSVKDSDNLKEFYAQESYGVLVTDEKYLKQVFGEYTYTGNPNDKDYGIIITDYLADSILFHRADKYKSYEDILGEYRNKDHSAYCYINAIIHTDYQNTHKALIDQIKYYIDHPKEFDAKTFRLTDEYLHFSEEVKNYLAITYSLNPNFIAATNNPAARNLTMLCHSEISFPDSEYKIELTDEWAFIDSEFGIDLPKNTLGVSFLTLKKFLALPEETTMEDVEPYQVFTYTLKKFRRYHPDDEPVLKKAINIKVIDSLYFDFVVSDDLFAELRNYDVIPYGLNFDDLKTAPSAYAKLKDVPFIPRSSYIEAGISINNVVIIFKDIFALIASILLISVLMILGFNTFINVNRRKYDIGIFKALGMKNKDIASIYIIQILFSTILIVIAYIIGLIVLTHYANIILFNSFMQYLKNPALKAINILTFNPWVLLFDIAIIVIVNIVITLIPFLIMKRVKPLGIIRKAD